jgi:hypothetical protein
MMAASDPSCRILYGRPRYTCPADAVNSGASGGTAAARPPSGRTSGLVVTRAPSNVSGADRLCVSAGAAVASLANSIALQCVLNKQTITPPAMDMRCALAISWSPYEFCRSIVPIGLAPTCELIVTKP